MRLYGRLGVAFLAWIVAATAWAANGSLKVGAARVDITPTAAELPAPYTKVHDPIYVRTILLDDGKTKTAIVVVDVPMIEGQMYEEMASAIAQQVGCPVENVMLAISHTHSSLRLDTAVRGKRIPFTLAFNAKVKESITESIRMATAKLEPAKAGFGRGKAYVAANRNEWSASERRYKVGVDRTGKEPFDPALDVVKFESMTGEPIAWLIEYGIEPVVAAGAGWEISGDVPGAAARYVEEHSGSNAVAAFTVGAAGDPVYSGDAGGMKAGRKTSSAFEILSAMGTMLGEEVIAVSSGIKAEAEVKVSAAMKVVECPGKITTPLNLPNSCAYTPDSKLPACKDYRDEDIGPVGVRVGVLRIGDFAITHADVNVEPKLSIELLGASPLLKTMFVSTNFGPGWFVVKDSTYPLNTYEATASRLKMGCGENALVGSALQMLR